MSVLCALWSLEDTQIIRISALGAAFVLFNPVILWIKLLPSSSSKNFKRSIRPDIATVRCMQKKTFMVLGGQALQHYFISMQRLNKIHIHNASASSHLHLPVVESLVPRHRRLGTRGIGPGALIQRFALPTQRGCNRTVTPVIVGALSVAWTLQWTAKPLTNMCFTSDGQDMGKLTKSCGFSVVAHHSQVLCTSPNFHFKITSFSNLLTMWRIKQPDLYVTVLHLVGHHSIRDVSSILHIPKHLLSLRGAPAWRQLPKTFAPTKTPSVRLRSPNPGDGRLGLRSGALRKRVLQHAALRQKSKKYFDVTWM